MIERVHGIDRHKQFSTISVLNRRGEEVQFIGCCRELGKYVQGLGSSDAVVLEASTGSFWWADQIEARGAKCFVMDPHKFRIIKDSWNKTDKSDARNLAKALWVHVVTGEFGIPTVYKPTERGAGAEEAIRAVLSAQPPDRDSQEQRPGDLRRERGGAEEGGQVPAVRGGERA